MKQLERLKHIYSLLLIGPQTIESILSNFEQRGVQVSKRQVYRDLEDVKHFYLREGEVFEQRSMEFNRKVWLINRHTEAVPLTSYDIDTYLLGVATTPIGLINGRKGSLQKMQMLVANHLSNSKIEHNATWDGHALSSTHFFEVPFPEPFQDFLGEMLWATANQRSIRILAYDGDSVSFYESLTLPFVLHPVKLIYHRGSFYLAGIIPASGHCVVVDAFQIEKYELTNETFQAKQYLSKVEKDLNNRFGITQNIDDGTYDIVLEFGSETGKYLKNFNWHHSQKFEELPNGNWVLTLSCGLNRELVGWIFQWTGNVKIIAPQALMDFHRKKMERIQEVQKSNGFNYMNFMRPK